MSSTRTNKRKALTVMQDTADNVEPASKRRSSGKQGGSANKQSKTSYPTNVFTTSLKEAGFILSVSGNKILCDANTFKQKLQNFLSESDLLSDSNKHYIKALEKSFDGEAEFVAALFPTELDSSSDLDISSCAELLQDSLIKILLDCEDLQAAVIELLTNKLPLYADNENVTVSLSPTVCGDTDIVNIPRLILNQLRWLDYIQSSTTLATKLLQMASVMQSVVSCDIVSFIPDLLSDDVDHSTVAASLCDLMSDGPDNITSAVFDALSNLVLSPSVTKDVQFLAICKLSSGSLADLPVIVKFLLKSCSSGDIAKEVISEMRTHLDFSILLDSDESESTLKSTTSLLADGIFSAMQFQPCIASSWITVLEKVTVKEFNVGDIVAVLYLCSIQHVQNQKTAASLLNSKIRKNLVPLSIMKQTFETCSHLLAPHFRSICTIAKTMVWHSASSIKKVGALFYELFLLHMDNYCKQEAIGFLVEHVSAVSSDAGGEADTALSVLCNVAQNKPSVLTPYTNYLRDALDRMDLMTLSQVRKSYTVLSCLAFNESSDVITLGIRDEIHMMLQKQLAHTSDRYRHIGIIGCVATLLAMARMKKDGKFDGAKEIASLLQTLNYVLRSNLLGWSLFYDEVHVAFDDGDIIFDALIKKVSDDARTKLQDEFLGDVNQPPSSSGSLLLDRCFRYGLLSDEEMRDNAFAILVSGTSRAHGAKQAPAMLCSLFRAIATLERISKGSLGEIDALLCCPVYIHDAKYEEKDAFLQLSDSSMISVLDTLFVTVNWFRELLSVFSPETEEDVEPNVLSRLKETCEMQTTVELLLRHAPVGYAPPHLSANVRDSSANKWKSHGSSVGNETLKSAKNLDKSVSSTAGPQKAAKEKKSSSSASQFNPSMLRPHLRELSFDVFRLLRYPVKFNESESDVASEDLHLQSKHLRLLLKDLKEKVTHRLTSSKLPNGFGRQTSPEFGFEKLDRMSPEKVAHQTIKLVPHLCRHLNEVVRHLQADATKTDDPDSSISSEHSGIFIQQHKINSQCLEFILETLLCLSSWLKTCGSESLLVSFVTHMANGAKEQNHTGDHTSALSAGFRYLASIAPALPSSTSAHVLLKLLIAVRSFADSHKTQQAWMARRISNVANDFLKRDWSDCTFADKPAKVNGILSGMFAAHVKYSEDGLACIEVFLRNSLADLLGVSDEKEESEMSDHVSYPLLTKSNFYIFYKVMLEVLSGEAAAIKAPITTTAGRTSVHNVDLLLQWSEVVKVLDLLIRVLKSFPSRTTVGPALKYARSTVESFVRTGIPACEVTFREHQDDVINLLKKIQGSTRQLQHLACHSKASKDASLTNHVPALKRCLETFVFRVKALLVLHNCHEAFWLGNLKNRNLQGEEILSQAAPTQSSSEDDGDDNDEVAGPAERNETEKSYSECY